MKIDKGSTAATGTNPAQRYSGDPANVRILLKVVWKLNTGVGAPLRITPNLSRVRRECYKHNGVMITRSRRETPSNVGVRSYTQSRLVVQPQRT